MKRLLLKTSLLYGSYDFSNSGYVLVFQSFLFPIVLAHTLPSSVDSKIVWAWLVAISSVIATLGSPFVGKVGDKIGKGTLFSIVVIITGLLAFGSTLYPNMGVMIIGFLLFNILFEFSQNIYDSFLRLISEDKKTTISLSSFAWGMGYVGGAIFAVLYLIGEKNHISQNILLSGFALLYLILSLPSIGYFLKIQDKKSSIEKTLSFKDILHPKSPVPWIDIFIYWIIADCVTASVYFIPLFIQQSLNMETKVVGMFLLIAQIIAFPATIIMGKVAHILGRIKTIQFSLLIWAIALGLLFFAQDKGDLIPVMLLISCVIGSTQALLRAHFITRVSKEKSGEGVGFYAVAQKSASILSPILIVGVISIFHSIKPVFPILIGFVCIGFLLAPQLNKNK